MFNILNRIFELSYNDSDLIRLGPNRDGGYVINKSSLDDCDVLYTYGVSNDYNFEEHFLKVYPEKLVRMFDHTVNDPSEGKLKNCLFIQEALEVRETENFNSFESHLIRFNDLNKKVFLKIDVENYEYTFFRNIKTKKSILENLTGMVIEFHELNNPLRLIEFSLIISYLKNYFYITHVHGNNFTQFFDIDGEIIPQTIEVSFRSKKTNITYTNKENVNFPKINLDYPNNPNDKDIQLKV